MSLFDVSEVTDIRSESWGGGEHGHGLGRARQPPHRPHILVLLCPLKPLRAGIARILSFLCAFAERLRSHAGTTGALVSAHGQRQVRCISAGEGGCPCKQFAELRCCHALFLHSPQRRDHMINKLSVLSAQAQRLTEHLSRGGRTASPGGGGSDLAWNSPPGGYDADQVGRREENT